MPGLTQRERRGCASNEVAKEKKMKSKTILLREQLRAPLVFVEDEVDGRVEIVSAFLTVSCGECRQFLKEEK